MLLSRCSSVNRLEWLEEDEHVGTSAAPRESTGTKVAELVPSAWGAWLIDCNSINSRGSMSQGESKRNAYDLVFFDHPLMGLRLLMAFPTPVLVFFRRLMFVFEDIKTNNKIV